MCQKDVCDCWRDALWATHESVNRGARVFGDRLLTLRWGLCHTLADMEVRPKGKKVARKPTDDERRDQRVLLALSWLSVEDERGAPDMDGADVGAILIDIPDRPSMGLLPSRIVCSAPLTAGQRQSLAVRAECSLYVSWDWSPSKV